MPHFRAHVLPAGWFLLAPRQRVHGCLPAYLGTYLGRQIVSGHSHALLTSDLLSTCCSTWAPAYNTPANGAQTSLYFWSPLRCLVLQSLFRSHAHYLSPLHRWSSLSLFFLVFLVFVFSSWRFNRDTMSRARVEQCPLHYFEVSVGNLKSMVSALRNLRFCSRVGGGMRWGSSDMSHMITRAENNQSHNAQPQCTGCPCEVRKSCDWWRRCILCPACLAFLVAQVSPYWASIRQLKAGCIIRCCIPSTPSSETAIYKMRPEHHRTSNYLHIISHKFMYQYTYMYSRSSSLIEPRD